MIDWNDNAKAAVDYFADWLRADCGYIASLEDFYNRLSQTKTVADAVEYYKGVWPSSTDDCIWYSETLGFEYGFVECDSQEVCTRAEFEAYVKEQESLQQSCSEVEKWTHTYYNNKCTIVASEPDKHGYIAIKTEKAGYQAVDKDALKPIKPTITKSQAWDKMQEMSLENVTCYYAYTSINEKYEVIDD